MGRGVEGWRERLGTVGGVWLRVCTLGLVSVLGCRERPEYLLSCYRERFGFPPTAHYAHSGQRGRLLRVSVGRSWCGGGALMARGRGSSLRAHWIACYPQSPPN